MNETNRKLVFGLTPNSQPKMNRAAEQSHLELSQLHHPFPILESLSGASIGADETVAFVRELLEIALVPAEAPGRRGVSHLAAFLAGLPSRGQEIDCRLQSSSR